MTTEFVVEFHTEEDHGNGWSSTTRCEEFDTEEEAVDFLVRVNAGDLDEKYEVQHKYDAHNYIFKRTWERVQYDQEAVAERIRIKKEELAVLAAAKDAEKIKLINEARDKKDREEFERLKAKFERQYEI